MLTPALLPRIQQRLADLELDGWLLYDFRGTNAIAAGLLGFSGLLSRRVFAYIPREGLPVSIRHAIEPGPWASWPAEWPFVVYSGWEALEGAVASQVRGKRIAMEYSPGDAIPYLDRVPAGVLDMVRSTGATVVCSGELVSAIYAVWSDADRASHTRAAATVRDIAHAAFARIDGAFRAGTPIAEHEVQAFILDAFARHGLETDHGPDVAASENAANPHYVPSVNAPRILRPGDSVLIDLWAREPGGVYADQTWMATIGAPTERMRTIWHAIRDARDAAITLLAQGIAAGDAVRGRDADEAARTVITDRGFGPYFTHRTGHSIDARELHGSGPQLDNMESRDDRILIPGVGFSIEPGIYIPGEIGMRTEVNAYVTPSALVVTPAEPQRELLQLGV